MPFRAVMLPAVVFGWVALGRLASLAFVDARVLPPRDTDKICTSYVSYHEVV